MVRVCGLLTLCLILACKQQVDVGTLILEAQLVGGERIRDVQVSLIQDFRERFPEADVIVRDASGNERFLEWEDESSSYHDPQLAPFVFDDAWYEIEVRAGDYFAHAEVKVPPTTNLTEVSAAIIPIDENSPGQPIFSVLWENLEGYTHVLTLENLEEFPVEIPFSVPAGNFSDIYALPVTSQGVTLFDTDFTYYGIHRLKIYTIDSAYDALYFYQPGDAGNIVDSGPENVNGGAGFVTGLSVVEIELELTP